jgi:hypothetical protein
MIVNFEILVLFLDRLGRRGGQDFLDLFFACGDTPFGRRPHYPDNPVNPV